MAEYVDDEWREMMVKQLDGKVFSIVSAPELGAVDQVEVIEVSVAPGDQVDADQVLFVLETEKAALDVTAPSAGQVDSIQVAEGDKVVSGAKLCTLSLEEKASATAQPAEEVKQTAKKPASVQNQQPASTPAPIKPVKNKQVPEQKKASNEQETIHAGPSVRQMARQLNVPLEQVNPTGPLNRVLKEDVESFIQSTLSGARQPQAAITQDRAVPMSKIRRITAERLTKSWQTIPHVTHFETADITALEQFRKQHRSEEMKLTILPFLLKASAHALKQFPDINARFNEKQHEVILQGAYNIGVAVDTDQGIMVPVLRHVDQKNILDLARESSDLIQKARAGRLPFDAMQGGTFSISSLGGLGGTAFTPIVNPPEVAILGISKASQQPVWQETSASFEPGLCLPLSLSYDHRVIDGALAARFMTCLKGLLADIRQCLL